MSEVATARRFGIGAADLLVTVMYIRIRRQARTGLHKARAPGHS